MPFPVVLNHNKDIGTFIDKESGNLLIGLEFAYTYIYMSHHDWHDTS
jgi:hypothetical protein